MINSIQRWVMTLAAPAVCVLLLGGMSAQNRTYLKTNDFEPFHAKVVAEADKLPMSFDNWVGAFAEVPKPALRLLNPNVIRCVEFTEIDPARLANPRRALFVMVQCKRSGDMVGHYPPRCYAATGYELVDSQERDWRVGDTTLPGTEYSFVRNAQGGASRVIVYNFMIVPRRGIFRDISGVRSAAEDYQQRYFGAAQFQVVFDGPMCDLPRQERDEVAASLLRPTLGVIALLKAGI
jgi:hypothetical protein